MSALAKNAASLECLPIGKVLQCCDGNGVLDCNYIWKVLQILHGVSQGDHVALLTVEYPFNYIFELLCGLFHGSARSTAYGFIEGTVSSTTGQNLFTVINLFTVHSNELILGRQRPRRFAPKERTPEHITQMADHSATGRTSLDSYGLSSQVSATFKRDVKKRLNHDGQICL